MSSASIYGRGVTGLLKKYWHEYPGVMGASAIGIAGLGLCIYDMYLFTINPLPPKYKRSYDVVRSDDPRATQAERTYPLGDYFKK